MECCGVLVGIIGSEADRVTAVIPTINAAASPSRFEIGPDEQARVMRTVRWSTGEHVLAVYHSHPIGPAVPSYADRVMALDGQVSVIVGFAPTTGDPVMTAWWLPGGTERQPVSVPLAIAHGLCDPAPIDQEPT